MNFLNWNVRGINSTKKRQILADIVTNHHIDILALQETKKETFTDRILRTISKRLMNGNGCLLEASPEGYCLDAIVINFELLIVSLENFLWMF